MHTDTHSLMLDLDSVEDARARLYPRLVPMLFTNRPAATPFVPALFLTSLMCRVGDRSTREHSTPLHALHSTDVLGRWSVDKRHVSASRTSLVSCPLGACGIDRSHKTRITCLPHLIPWWLVTLQGIFIGQRTIVFMIHNTVKRKFPFL